MAFEEAVRLEAKRRRCLARVGAAAPVRQPARLSAIFSEVRDLRGSFRWFLADRSNDFVASFYFWLNLLFLADHVAAVLVARNLRRHRDTLAEVFLLVGSLDADIAIASLLQRIPAHCPPTMTTEKTIEVIDGFHPLLADPVANSIALCGQSALVVGTNMAGKTTFIKMVGTNIILGRTLGVCFAAKAVVPRLKVLTSIRAEHSIESGKSHFVEDPDLPEVFDYRLHPGMSTTKNAIKLLEKLGFPPAIVREARRLAGASTCSGPRK